MVEQAPPLSAALPAASPPGSPAWAIEQVRQIGATIARLEDQLGEMREVLTSLGAGERGSGMDTIIRIVAEDFGLPTKLLRGDWRRRDMVEARQIAMWIAREGFGRTLASIGAFLGRREHTTVSHGVETVAARRARDPEFRARTDRLRDQSITTVGGL